MNGEKTKQKTGEQKTRKKALTKKHEQQKLKLQIAN